MTDVNHAARPGGDLVRHIVFAVGGMSSRLDPATEYALGELRRVATTISVVHRRSLDAASRAALGRLADSVAVAPTSSFTSQWYAQPSLRAPQGTDEMVLTGDGAIGPMPSLPEVLTRMDTVDVDVWQMAEDTHGPVESFPEEGFPEIAVPWMWTAVRRAVFGSPAWADYWTVAAGGTAGGHERDVVPHLRDRGFRGDFAFRAADFPSSRPALFDAELMLEGTAPYVEKAIFQAYPPYLDRQAVIGREIASRIESVGYPAPLLWGSLARTSQPKALNANAGMLEVLHGDVVTAHADTGQRVAVIARVSDLDAIDELLSRIGTLPAPFDAYLTTTDGTSAARLERRVESWWGAREGRFEIRVTPASPGRDMADFFVGCRDVLTSDEYDIVVKLHARKNRRKTANVARYFRRYQYENLLKDEAYTRQLLDLFRREPGLGVVFPPMMHIGYPLMGRGWAGLHGHAQQAARELGISVPLDAVSPLAPYGGMFVARVDALRQLTQHAWSFGDYTGRRGQRYGHLQHLQERLIVPAAAERGYHARTVLTPEHAAISHTALDYKVDELFSTTRGYPVEQIRLLHRAGFTGYGGPVALARMYLRINHPRAIGRLRPFYRLAFRAYPLAVSLRRVVGRLRPRASEENV